MGIKHFSIGKLVYTFLCNWFDKYYNRNLYLEAFRFFDIILLIWCFTSVL
jgi:hypothetical protein